MLEAFHLLRQRGHDVCLLSVGPGEGAISVRRWAAERNLSQYVECFVVIPGLNGFMCDLTVDSLANAIVGAMNSGPANEELIHATRAAFSKARWDNQILTFPASRLEFDSGNKRDYE